MTGEDPEELIASLNWQLEAEIDPDEIYKRALVEGTLNKQTERGNPGRPSNVRKRRIGLQPQSLLQGRF